MERPALMLVLALVALPVTALVQAQTSNERLTPRPPPTAVMPKLTPDHTEPKDRAPAGIAVLQPAPVVAPPLSPIVVPGEPPAVPAIAMAAPAGTPAPAVAAVPPSAKPKPDTVRPVEKKATARILYAKEGIYIRATPSRTGRVLDTLEEGEAAQVLPDKAPESGWVRIARNGRPAGWVASSYLAERRAKRP